MKNILILCVTAVLLFSVSAAISLFLQSSASKRGEQDKDAGKEDKSKDKDKAAGRPAEDTVPPIAQQPTPASSEQVTRLLARLQEREQALKKRNEDARKQEQRLEILMEDVRGERAVIDSLRKQLSDELKRLGETQENISRKARGLEEQKEAAAKLLADMRKRQIEFEKGESVNLTRMATISDSMPPEKAAAIIKQLADGGQLETAVKLLGQMKERRAAQVLAEMTDVDLAAQLLAKLRGLKREPATQPATKKEG